MRTWPSKVEETVIGEAPVVVIRNGRSQVTVDQDTLAAIPTTGPWINATLIAGPRWRPRRFRRGGV
jgi:hypothetical protein